MTSPSTRAPASALLHRRSVLSRTYLETIARPQVARDERGARVTLRARF